ncbi:MAG: CRISPR-associated protein Cas4 [Desulfitibacter sp. BRH_c19]|nr:MAG: CRISPR-associated protein Cas4 [Desulfitibacter sp. BRH_c19]
MKSFQSFFNENQYYVTPSEIIEFMYCRRFIYFMKCLGIRQYEENRYKVQKGRVIHDKKEKQNREYLRKKLGVVAKEMDVSLVSNTYKIRGKVDEVLTLLDGTLAPLDYKFTKYDGVLYQTYLTQVVMYGLMIEETYDRVVKKGFIVYCRGGHDVKEIEITEKNKTDLKETIREFLEVIQGHFPKATRFKARCLDCCYKNICVR